MYCQDFVFHITLENLTVEVLSQTSVEDVTISLYILLYIFNINDVLCKREYSAIKDIKKVSDAHQYMMHMGWMIFPS